ncbi:MAG: zinc-finger-containing protein [Lachnospirales bacterium]
MKSKKIKSIKKLTKKQTEKLKITCPYCGKEAILQNKSYVHGKNSIGGGKLYVCYGYPACDSYVTAHSSTNEPQGTLANRELRLKRIETHEIFNKIVYKNIMTKKESYMWLGCRLQLNSREAHIAMLTYDQCNELILHCRKLLENNQMAC